MLHFLLTKLPQSFKTTLPCVHLFAHELSHGGTLITFSAQNNVRFVMDVYYPYFYLWVMRQEDRKTVHNALSLMG